MSTPIRLRAEDDEDLAVISACLQDAILPMGEMCYEPTARRFVLVVNRFKWESVDGGDRKGPKADDDHLFPYERTQCGVRFEGVTAVRVRGINLRDRRQMLELLSVVPTDSGVQLTFAGGGALRLEGGCRPCIVEDLGAPWPTSNCPHHEPEEDGAAA